MGFFKNIIGGISKKHGLSSDRKIEGYVRACEYLYNLCVSMYPDKDPHEHLVIVLCTIWTKSGAFKEAEIDEPTQSREIVAYTLLPACLPPQYRARILAYKLIMEDKELSSRICTGYPAYYNEYTKVVKSIWDAKRNGTLLELYSRYNRNKLHREILFPEYRRKGEETLNLKTQQNINLQGCIVAEVSQLIGQVSQTIMQKRIILCV